MPASLPMDSDWQPVKIGAGGFVTGMDIARDGTMVARTDTYGAYIWNGSSWAQLVTTASMPGGVYGAGGVYEIRIAPSNSNIIYMEMDGGIYRSVDRGAHWALTAAPAFSLNPNGDARGDGDKMAIDPNNPDIVFAGTQQNGLWMTRDGGGHWLQLSAVPRGAGGATANDTGLTGIVFDTSGGTLNGTTRVIYAATDGSGVYRSTDGGTTWSALSGGPADVQHASVGADGSYYANSALDQSLWKYANGSWTKLNISEVHIVTADPYDASHVIAVRDSGNIQESHDAGATWSGWSWSQQLESSNDVPWLENSGAYMTSGQLLFDPQVRGRVWQSAGVGVWSADLPATASTTPLVWNSHSLGIEQLVANDIIAPAGDNPVVGSWDRPFFELTNADSYSTSYSGGLFSMGWSLDYASSNSRFVVGISDWYGVENSGFSTDGGHSWQRFATMPSFAGSTIGGSIAASSPTNIIWAPAGGYAPVYTLDGGATWTTISLPGKTSDWGAFHQGYWLDRTTITADRVLPNTFYLYDVATGVYVTHDGGAHWTLAHSGQVAPWSQFSAKIEAVPGSPGELFFTSGPQADGTNTTPPDNSFMHSTDGGVTWTAVAGVKEVNTFGYGAPATAGGPASIYIVGWLNNEYGVFYSTDDGQHWSQIGRYPLGSLDAIRTISGDMDEFGSVYIGFAGSGYAHLTVPGTATTTPPPATTDPTQTANITSADDNVGAFQTVGTGALVNDSTPTLHGTISAALASGQFLAVLRDGQAIGQASTSLTSWSYTDPGAADGTHSYVVRVQDGAGHTGTSSTAFTLAIDATAPRQQVGITAAVDDAGYSTGTLANGAVTDDFSPLLRGSISAALGSGESLVIYRDGARDGVATVANGSWTFAEPNLSGGVHSYTARVEDAAGNAGASSAAFTLSIEPVHIVTGTIRSDVLIGTAAADRLSGVPDSGSNLGKGTIDVLTGGSGSDLFVLGDARGRFYDDGKGSSSGMTDYARITDFGSDDKIQLKGVAANYFQSQVTVNGVSGDGIFHDSNGNGIFDARDELIGLVQNHGALDASSFIFV